MLCIRALTTLYLLTSCTHAIHVAKGEGEHKCTSRDTRQTYPHCMLYSVDKSLWCDQSSYTRIPSVKEMNKYIPFRNCEAASALYVNDSCLAGISRDDLSGLKHITAFYGDRNRIEELHDSTFEENRKLRVIHLCSNKIAFIHNTAFKGLNELQSLNLANNQISELEPGTLQELRSLRTLRLDNNDLMVLDDGLFRGLENLKELHIPGNKLSVISENAFPDLRSLTTLRLDGNRIRNVQKDHFKDIGGLEVLTMSHNLMTYWPEGVSLKELHTLVLDDNAIATFGLNHVANMSKLQNLSLGKNSLKHVDEDQFSSTPLLAYISLEGNYIEEIPRHTFKGLCHLRRLVLRGNQLRSPHQEWYEHLYKNKRETDLTDIGGNQWHCDCTILDYKNFLGDMQGLQYTGTEWEKLDIVCNSPKKYQGRKLSEIFAYEFEECQKATPSHTPTSDSSTNCSTATFTPQPLPAKYSQITGIHSKDTEEPSDEGDQEGIDPVTLILSLLAVVTFFVAAMALVFWWVRCRNVQDSEKGKSKSRQSTSADAFLEKKRQKSCSRRTDVVFEEEQVDVKA